MKSPSHVTKWVVCWGIYLGHSACQLPETNEEQTLNVSETERILSRGRVVTRNKQIPSHVLSLSPATASIFQSFQDPDTNEARWLLFDTEIMPYLSEAELGSFAKSWFAEHEDEFNLASADTLKFHDFAFRRLDERLVSLSFKQVIGGIAVKDAFVDFIFLRSKDGSYQLREFVNQTTSLAVSSSQPDFSFEALLERLDWPDAILLDSRPLWIIDDESSAIKAAREYTLEQEGEAFTWIVAGENHHIVEGFRHRLSAQGLVEAEVYERSYLEGDLSRSPIPLAYTWQDDQVHVTTVDGRVASGVQLTHVQLDGPRARVFEGMAITPLSIALQADEDNLWVAGGGDKLPALNAYTATYRINRYVRHFLSPEEVPYLNKSIDIRVNVEGECNAFYTTGVRRITLYGKGKRCANLALVNDVVYHEWGHGLDEFTGRQIGVMDGAFSEGIGDLVSAYFTGDPVIGRGFVINRDSGIRSLENKRSFPKDVGDVHREGGIIGGVFWELRQGLISRYGKTRGEYLAGYLFFRHLLSADSYQDSYQAVLRLDDLDGNPATRSPNFCLINQAFAARGLAKAVGCYDEVPAIYQRSEVDEDLYLALMEIASGETGLVGSSATAQSLAICLGDRDACLAGGRVHLNLMPVDNDVGRRYFVYDQILALKGLDLVTIIAKNKQGQVIGSRVVKIVSK